MRHGRDTSAELYPQKDHAMTKAKMSDYQIQDAARRRYFRDARAEWGQTQQPGAVTVGDDGVVELSNVRGTLARYRYTIGSTGKLRLTAVD